MFNSNIFLKFKSSSSSKEKILTVLLWSISLHFIYLSIEDFFYEYNKYFKSISFQLLFFSYIGVLFKLKIARLYWLGTSYLIIFEFVLSQIFVPFNETFYISYPTLIYAMIVIYILNTIEMIKLFHLENYHKERYYFIFIFICLSIILFLKRI